MTDLPTATKWLEQNGGAWRKERVSDGWRIVASARGVSRQSVAVDASDLTAAVLEAVRELRRAVAQLAPP